MLLDRIDRARLLGFTDLRCSFIICSRIDKNLSTTPKHCRCCSNLSGRAWYSAQKWIHLLSSITLQLCPRSLPPYSDLYSRVYSHIPQGIQELLDCYPSRTTSFLYPSSRDSFELRSCPQGNRLWLIDRARLEALKDWNRGNWHRFIILPWAPCR